MPLRKSTGFVATSTRTLVGGTIMNAAFTARSTMVNVFASTTPRTRIRTEPTMISISLNAAHAAAPNGDVGTVVSTTTGAKLGYGHRVTSLLPPTEELLWP